ncbi:MAG: hypothetical protein Kow0063_05000 [Anaerolineae bacterium]
MSRMLCLLNRIKAEARRDLLTGNQLIAFEEIKRLWQFPERVNLWGPPGSGKTMVGWVVGRSLHATIYSSPDTFRERSQYGEARVIVDNVPYDQHALRTVLAEMQLKNIRTALLITIQPNRLGLPTVALRPPTTEDIDVLYRNLSLMEHYALSPLREGNFWDIIYSVL